MKNKLHTKKPGTISISLKHAGGGKITAHYFFPDFEFSECAWDELRSAARTFSDLASVDHHACGMRMVPKRHAVAKALRRARRKKA